MSEERPKAQLDKFKEAARELECDGDDAAFRAVVSRIAKGSVDKPRS